MKCQVTHVNKQVPLKFANLLIRPLLEKKVLDNFNLFHAHLVKKANAPLVRHNRTHEIVICLKGSFHALLNNKRYSLMEGNIIWIPAGTWHMFKTSSTDAKALAIFTPRLNIRNKPDVEVYGNQKK